MNKRYLLLLFLLLIPISYAEMLISPNGFTGSVYLNTEKTAQIQILNNYTHPIYNITALPTSYISFSTIDSLQPGEHKNITLTVLATDTFDTRTFNTIIKFSYSSIINYDTTTYDINISRINFTPQTTTLYLNDKIRFNNFRNLTANIRDQYSPTRYFDQILLENQSVIIQGFNQIDDFTFTETNSLLYGRIIVQNRSQELVNNPENNIPFPITFDSKYISSTLGMDIYPFTNFSMDYDQIQELSMSIWNSGNRSIYNITINSSDYQNWFSFDKNDFELLPQQNIIIKITVSTDLNESYQTNKTYNLNVIAKSENSEQVSKNLQIFIPYEKSLYLLSNFTREQLIEYVTTLNSYLDDLLKSQEPQKEKIVYLNSTVSFTKEEMQGTLRRITEQQATNGASTDKNTQSINTIGEKVDSVNGNISILISIANDSLTNSKKALKQSDDASTNVTLVIFIIVLSALAGLLVYKSKKSAKEKIDKMGSD